MPCIAPVPDVNCPGPGPAPDANRCLVCTRKSNVKARRASLALRARGEWLEPMTGTQLIQKWTANIDNLLKSLRDEFLVNKGVAPPCDYAFIICGSGARKEACPYSDLDCAMLVSDEQTANVAYFKEMCTYIDEQLQTLGEEGNVQGIRFCGGGLNPLGRRGAIKTDVVFMGRVMSRIVELIRTPQSMAAMQESPEDAHVSEGLLETRFSFGSQEQLHTAYRTEIDTILGKCSPDWSWRPLLKDRKRRALEMFKEVVGKFGPPNPNADYWKLKDSFYRAPQFTAKCLSMWYGVDAVGTVDQVNALRIAGRLSAGNAQLILRVLDTVARIRVISHLEMESEADVVWTYGNHAKRQNAREKLLTQAETNELRAIIPDLDMLNRLARAFLASKQKAVGTRTNPFA